MKPALSAWFAGPKSENSDAFMRVIRRILEDHTYWRRNYFPEDGVVVTSEVRRENAGWNDVFEDKLLELLAALKVDCPFSSPRYAAHMVAEQTLPGIAGYFAGMLYNPNNVSKEAAPVTVKLELEVGRIIAAMLGFEPDRCWTHLTSGGTVANLEALWVARTVKYLPLLLRDLCERFDLEHSYRNASPKQLLGVRPEEALEHLETVFDLLVDRSDDQEAASSKLIQAYRSSEWNVTLVGLPSIVSRLGSEPILLAPESYHYCIPKACDILGLGRRSIRHVKVDANFRMRPDDLERRLDQLDADGNHVVAVIGIAGSTEEGAVDPIDEIIEIRDRRESEGKPSFWVHVDAAYGGYLRTAQLPERVGYGPSESRVHVHGRNLDLPLSLPDTATADALDSMGMADSAIVDPHKLGYVPYPAGVVCFRSNLVRPVMRQNAPYIEEAPSGPSEERHSDNIGVYILEGSKPGASAASVWLSHTTIPLDTTGHGALVRETIRNAAELHALLEHWNEIEPSSRMQAVTLCPPGSNIVCYAFRPRDGAPRLSLLNGLNRSIYRTFSLDEGRRLQVYDQNYFVSRTSLSADQYSSEAVAPFLDRFGVTADEWRRHGVFLLRSTLMNPWYDTAKAQGKHYLVGLVQALFDEAEKGWAESNPAR